MFFDAEFIKNNDHFYYQMCLMRHKAIIILLENIIVISK